MCAWKCDAEQEDEEGFCVAGEVLQVFLFADVVLIAMNP